MPGRAEVDDYVEQVAGATCEVFGDRVVGVWLLGSLAYGGFGPTSDIDVQAAVRRPTGREIATLVERIRHPNLPCPAEGLEYVLYDVNAIATPVPPLRWSLNLNGGPARAVSVSTDPASESWHWFVLDLAIGRETARTLRGADLRDVAGPVAPDDVVAAIAESVRWHDAHEAAGPNRVANAARALRYLRTGRWGSKPDGLAWADTEGLADADVCEQLADAVRARDD